MPEGVPDPGRHSRDADRRGGALGPDEITAVILAGGQGTRLRPLTLGTPKPIVPLLNIPFLAYQLALLRRHGITDVVLSCSYLVDEVRRTMGDGAEHGVRLSYAVETDPLGTAGGVRNAVDLVRGLVVVLNGDILADLDLSAMLRFHAERGSRATLYLTRVPDPTQYGLVELDPDGAIRAFVEKPDPGRVTTDTVNAGVYALDRSVVTAIPTGRAVSIERETFPALLRDRVPFFGWVSASYWLDIGSPAKYRQGQLDLLAGKVATDVTPPGDGPDRRFVAAGVRVAADAALIGPCVVGAGSRLEPGARVGPNAILGARCIIGAGARIDGAILWDDVTVGPGSVLRDCIVASGARIGASVELGPTAVLGAGATVADRTCL
ncbi:MAG TPA: NDP-sugar synthase [Methylomirabilota bacterium]|nr:NDP-sugar synthase [Methylomirabilota bacterium]